MREAVYTVAVLIVLWGAYARDPGGVWICTPSRLPRCPSGMVGPRGGVRARGDAGYRPPLRPTRLRALCALGGSDDAGGVWRGVPPVLPNGTDVYSAPSLKIVS